MQILRHSQIAVVMEIYTEATSLLYGTCKRPVAMLQPASYLRGRYWDRTSDLFGVN
jgi:hypothetical protein